jgi:hypothetical protein
MLNVALVLGLVTLVTVVLEEARLRPCPAPQATTTPRVLLE